MIFITIRHTYQNYLLFKIRVINLGMDHAAPVDIFQNIINIMRNLPVLDFFSQTGRILIHRDLIRRGCHIRLMQFRLALDRCQIPHSIYIRGNIRCRQQIIIIIKQPDTSPYQAIHRN